MKQLKVSTTELVILSQSFANVEKQLLKSL